MRGSKTFSTWLLLWGTHAHLQNGSGQKLGRWKWGGTSWKIKMGLWWMLILLKRPTLVTRKRESQHWKKCPPRAPNPLLRLSPQRRKLPRKALLRRQRAVTEALNKSIGSRGSNVPSPFPVLDPNFQLMKRYPKSPIPRIPQQRVQGEVRNAGNWICWTYRSRSLRRRSRSPGPMVLSVPVFIPAWYIDNCARNVWNQKVFRRDRRTFPIIRFTTLNYVLPLSLGKVGPHWFLSIFILCTSWGLKGVVNAGIYNLRFDTSSNYSILILVHAVYMFEMAIFFHHLQAFHWAHESSFHCPVIPFARWMHRHRGHPSGEESGCRSSCGRCFSWRGL